MAHHIHWNTLSRCEASYGVDVSKFRNSVNVWSQDAMLTDVTNATMSERETKSVNDLLTQIGRLFKQTSATTLKALEDNQNLAQAIETYNNSFVRAGTLLPDSRKHVRGLISNRQAYYKKEIASKKSQRGKDTWKQK